MTDFKSSKPKPSWISSILKPTSDMAPITKAVGRTPNQSMAERRTVTTSASNTVGDRVQADYVNAKKRS